MLTRKDFLKTGFMGVVGMSVADWLQADQRSDFRYALDVLHKYSPEEAARDEGIWKNFREQFTVSNSIINLNNGGVSPQPKPVQEAHIAHYQYANQGPTWFMWKKLDQAREPLRKRLADLIHADPETCAIVRNTTEGMNNVIFGMDLKAGDEVVLSKYDYPNMVNAWIQRERREGIRLRWVDFTFPLTDTDTIVDIYRKAITPKTKLVMVTHVINWVGQTMPVRAIADVAHKAGAEIMVDGAHSFAQLPCSMQELDCDYFSTSLQKWLCAPFGTGLLYIRKSNISKIWPAMSAYTHQDHDIRKFEMTGTRSFPAEMAIHAAIDWHQLIGTHYLGQRLYHLKNYWMQKIKDLHGIYIYTPFDRAWSTGLGTIEIQGLSGEFIEEWLMENRKIHVTRIVIEKINGIRATPHIYTRLQELDTFIDALQQLHAQKR